MNCPACGRDVTGKKFCPICGRPVEQEAKAPVFVQSPESKNEPEIQPKIAEQFSYVSKPINLPQKQETENSSKKVLMVIICIVVALAIVFAGALAFLSVYNSGGEDAPQKETVTEDVKPKPQKEEKERSRGGSACRRGCDGGSRRRGTARHRGGDRRISDRL